MSQVQPQPNQLQRLKKQALWLLALIVLVAVTGIPKLQTSTHYSVYFDEKSGVTFATNKASLTADAKSNLDAVAEVFIEIPDTNLVVQGHTDNTGESAYNMELSKKRANAVVNYLNVTILPCVQFLLKFSNY